MFLNMILQFDIILSDVMPDTIVVSEKKFEYQDQLLVPLILMVDSGVLDRGHSPSSSSLIPFSSSVIRCCL